MSLAAGEKELMMDDQLPGSPISGDQSEVLDLLRRYASTTDPRVRSEILAQLKGVLGPEGMAAGRARIRDWFVGLEPIDELGAEAYERYQFLLPQVLAGTLGPTDAKHAEFMNLIASSDAASDEYEDLRGVLEEGYSAWGAEALGAATAASGDVIAPEVVGVSNRARFDQAIAIWSADIVHVLKTALQSRLAQLQIALAVRTSPVTGQIIRQVAGTVLEERRGLFAIQVGAAEGLPGPYRISARAEREDVTTCRVVIIVGGIGVRRGAGEIRITLALKSGQELSAPADENGIAIFEHISIEDLDGMKVNVSLPLPPGTAAPARE